jgi:hypothetical protein
VNVDQSKRSFIPQKRGASAGKTTSKKQKACVKGAYAKE